MTKFNFKYSNKSLSMTIGIVFFVLFIILVTCCLISMNSKSREITRNYQLITELNNKLGDYNSIRENITVLEQHINSIEVEQKKINIDYDNLNTRTARHEQDIVLLQTVVNDVNLDSRLDNIEVRIKNNETDIDSVQSIQRTQQVLIDNNSKSLNEYKSQIIQKVTSMMSTKKNNSTNLIKNSVNNINNFPYLLSSIEYRSGDKWAVFSPKNINSLSELKFLTIGDAIDNWRVEQIDDQSVKLKNGQNIYTLKVHH